MKYRFIFILLALLIALGGYAQKKVTILHSNDVHSRIEPINKDAADTLSAGKGGFIRIVNCAQEMRKKDPDLLLFDSGDFSQGTPFYNLFKGEVEIKLMNAAGYTAGTIGNHEFDFGLENMARLFRMADFPIVCANYDFTGTVLEGLVKPYIIIKRKGIKIGVFGLGTRLEGMVQASNCEGVTYLEPYETANRIAKLLKKKKKCDLVICLSHLGFQSSDKNPVSDTILAGKTSNIDIILGGHSHTLLQKVEVVNNLEGKNVYINQVGKSGIYLGELEIEF
ncbi:MAG: metallophosphatase [Bacteroides sp.]|nr:metallophosphatase [Bacteroides sp.]